MNRRELISEQDPDNSAEQVRAAREQARAARLFTLSEAATACGCSRSRIRRMLDAGAFPNAVQEDAPDKGASARVWHVPLADLLAAGLMPNREPDSAGAYPGEDAEQGEQVAGQELVELRHELALEQARRAAAEDLARERERTIESLERALRLLEAQNAPHPGDGLPATPSQGTQGPSPADRTGGIGETTAGAPAAPGEAVSWWARFRARMRD
jgi:AraC-like DNA-binding protein